MNASSWPQEPAVLQIGGYVGELERAIWQAVTDVMGPRSVKPASAEARNTGVELPPMLVAWVQRLTRLFLVVRGLG